MQTLDVIEFLLDVNRGWSGDELPALELMNELLVAHDGEDTFLYVSFDDNGGETGGPSYLDTTDVSVYPADVVSKVVETGHARIVKVLAMDAEEVNKHFGIGIDFEDDDLDMREREELINNYLNNQKKSFTHWSSAMSWFVAED